MWVYTACIHFFVFDCHSLIKLSTILCLMYQQERFSLFFPSIFDIENVDKTNEQKKYCIKTQDNV